MHDDRAPTRKKVVHLRVHMLTAVIGLAAIAHSSTSDRQSSATQPRDGIEGCPVTLPAHWPTTDVPGSVPEGSSHAWYGSERLAALVPVDGVWMGMGAESNYGGKFWWWRRGYDAVKEPTPNLTISALRLDGPAPAVEITRATNAAGVGTNWDAMLVGMEFPTNGCWEVRGTYNGTQELIVVVFVAEKLGL